MAIFKVPRITSAQRETLVLAAAEIVFDTDQLIYFGGDGFLSGGFPIGNGAQIAPKVEYFTLTSYDLMSGSVELSSAPAYPNAIRLVPSGGPEQIQGIDFIVTGKIVSWVGLGLDGILEENDVLIISY